MPDHAGRLPRSFSFDGGFRPEDRGGARRRWCAFLTRWISSTAPRPPMRPMTSYAAVMRRGGVKAGDRVGIIGLRRVGARSACVAHLLGARGACGGDQGGYLAAGQGTGCGGRAPVHHGLSGRDSSM